MTTVFKALGIAASDEEIKQVIRQMDLDGDGEISYEEFARVMGAQFSKKNSSEEIKAAFNYFDKDGDGYITVVVNILRSLSLKIKNKIIIEYIILRS